MRGIKHSNNAKIIREQEKQDQIEDKLYSKEDEAPFKGSR